jgi:hypothetical protein
MNKFKLTDKIVKIKWAVLEHISNVNDKNGNKLIRLSYFLKQMDKIALIVLNERGIKK